MGKKKAHEAGSSAEAPPISKKTYKDTLRNLQVELVKLQRHFIKCDDKILIILEGRTRPARTARSSALSST